MAIGKIVVVTLRAGAFRFDSVLLIALRVLETLQQILQRLEGLLFLFEINLLRFIFRWWRILWRVGVGRIGGDVALVGEEEMDLFPVDSGFDELAEHGFRRISSGNDEGGAAALADGLIEAFGDVGGGGGGGGGGVGVNPVVALQAAISVA